MGRSIEGGGPRQGEQFQFDAVAEYGAALQQPEPVLLSNVDTMHMLNLPHDVQRVVSAYHPRAYARERTVPMPILPAHDDPEALRAGLAHLAENVRQDAGIVFNEGSDITAMRDAMIIDGILAIDHYNRTMWAITDIFPNHTERRRMRQKLSQRDIEDRRRFEELHNLNQFRQRNGLAAVSFASGGIAQAVEPYNPRLASDLQQQEQKLLFLIHGEEIDFPYDEMSIQEKLAVVRVGIDTGAAVLRMTLRTTVNYTDASVT